MQFLENFAIRASSFLPIQDLKNFLIIKIIIKENDELFILAPNKKHFLVDQEVGTSFIFHVVC